MHLPNHYRSLAAVCLMVACQGGDDTVLPDCPAPRTGAPPPVSGLYRYTSRAFNLSGTITFESTDAALSVLDTTYDQVSDRALVGDGPWVGNHVDLSLAPSNGDTDYRADVTLAFSDDGQEFCLVKFSDSNDDRGGEGTYVGTREASLDASQRR